MKKFFRSIVAFLATITIGASVLPAMTANAATESVASSLDVNAKAAISIDAKTGKVLYAKNANTALPIASMTKLITVYLLREAIKSGKVKWTDKVTPDHEIYSISQDKSLSNVPLRADGSYSVKELYQATLIYSANAAAMMLGDIVAGSQDKFIDMMNAKLKSWGIEDATIVNACGLNNSDLGSYIVSGTSKTDENKMSAQDMALVAQKLLTDFPDVLNTTSIAHKTFRAGTDDATKMDNWDWMLPGLVYNQSDLKVDGLKTGTTDTAGDCFTGTATKNGMRIITVVLNAGGTGATKRFQQTATLMRWTFNNWTNMTVVGKNASVAGHKTIAVDKGKDTTVATKTAQTVTVPVPTGTTKKDVTLEYKAVKKSVAAPVKKGTTVGDVTVKVKGDNLGYVDGSDTGVQVKTTKTVEKAGFFRLMFRGIGNFFSNLF
jgi:D-alanyl-D-alanine carboxypeptidase (penicillin-binding protein 5/6)